VDKKDLELSSATWTKGVRVRDWMFDYSILTSTRHDNNRVESNNYWEHLRGSDDEVDYE
jgi:hypothetical protein